MGWCKKSAAEPWQKAIAGVLFLAFFAVRGHAQLGVPPIILVQPLNTSVLNGYTTLVTTTVAPSITPQKYYWFFNDQPVSTNALIVVSNAIDSQLNIVCTLAIFNANSTNAGTYSLRITNGVGSTVSSNAVLTVLSTTVSNVINIIGPGTGMTTNGFKVLLSGPSGSNFVVDASTDLNNWSPILTNFASTGTISCTDTLAKNFPIRFYRAHTQ